MKKTSLLILCAFLATQAARAQIVYVDANATGTNDGSSWANAYTQLGEAIKNTTVGQIWVAADTYKPVYDRNGNIPTDGRARTFPLKPGLSLYGGFAGTETSLAARDWGTNQTILDGDLLGNDDYSLPLNQILMHPTRLDDNAYHILDGLTSNPDGAVVDGFFVRNSNSQGPGADNGAGGGIIVQAINASVTVTVNNCFFQRNASTRAGAGVLFCQPGTASTLTANFENCAFTGNAGGYDPNYGDTYTSGFHIVAFNGTTTANFTNCTATGNDAQREGFFRRWNGQVNLNIKNLVMWGNVNGGIYEAGSGGSTTINYTDFEGGASGTGNIDTNPLFNDANGGDDQWGTLDDNPSLSPASPCLNAADPGYSYPALDLAHNARVIGSAADMGAFEHGCLVPTPTFTVTRPSCPGDADGRLRANPAPPTSGHSYLWSTGATTRTITGLEAGTYTVTVSKNNSGCQQAVASVVLPDPTPISISLTATNPKCLGSTDGRVVAAVSGGSGTKTYLWSTGATSLSLLNLAAGTYTMTVTDGKGCTASAEATLTEPTEVVLSFSTEILANGKMRVTLSASGGTPYTSGTPYKYCRVNPTTGGCGFSSTNVYSNLVPTQQHIFRTRDRNGCTDEVIVGGTAAQPTDSRMANGKAVDFDLSPNPSTDRFSLQTDTPAETDLHVQIFDLAGRMIAEKTWPIGTDRLEIQSLEWPLGVFVAKISNASGTPLHILRGVKTE